MYIVQLGTILHLFVNLALMLWLSHSQCCLSVGAESQCKHKHRLSMWTRECYGTMAVNNMTGQGYDLMAQVPQWEQGLSYFGRVAATEPAQWFWCQIYQGFMHLELE